MTSSKEEEMCGEGDLCDLVTDATNNMLRSSSSLTTSGANGLEDLLQVWDLDLDFLFVFFNECEELADFCV